MECMNKSDKLLAQCVLLERLLKDKLDEFIEEVKIDNPRLANIIRNDVRTLTRNHENFYKYIRPVIDESIFADFEILKDITERFFVELPTATSEPAPQQHLNAFFSFFCFYIRKKNA